MTDQSVLRLEQVSHVYVGDQGAHLVLENFNLSVGQGEFVSLVGPSGCGKTTALSLLAGLLVPTSGRALLNGARVTGPSMKVGYMLQQDYLFPWRTIYDNVAIGLEIAGYDVRPARIDGLLEELGLPGAGKRYPHELSGGMRQRVALARMLAADPDVMLLDEPFSALDMHIKLQLEQLVHDTLRRRGKTAVLVTHDLAEAAAMSDRVIVLARNPGRIRFELVVPEALSSAGPLEARRLPGFQEIFDRLWAELEQVDADLPAAGEDRKGGSSRE
ncbi:ABC transporter ATP-binding protein [Paenibacillus protaetiae]|uniref:ABC transporter ATP-binding protein n=1 Tax=Paenibacillus protaetiae TaxID=2509456 RepID=A0A4P6EUB2_9BACL|nr:ABC transporter ATP-binding protein [Paenibacillus protaetiae]QAY66065.1 ABC transporter ATP-binding protein [Paenibacillus protaetiae]